MTASGTASVIGGLLEKTKDYDKDERYMATSDLCNELQKDIKLDANMERRICTSVLKQLDDSSNDVQSIAVKCLGILLAKVGEPQVKEISDKLAGLVLDGKSELRDIYSIGLKTLVADVPDAAGCAVAPVLAMQLLGGIKQDATVQIKLDCLDITTDLIKRFGRQIESDHEEIMTVVLQQLSHAKVVVRKRASICLGSVAVVISDALLNSLTEKLLAQIQDQSAGNAKEPLHPDMIRTLIQTIGTISRTVGHRLGRHLDAVLPLFLQFCGDPDEEDDAHHTESASELRENCFHGFESFVLRCPREVTPHIPVILEVSLKYIKYDPNYNYGDSDNEEDAAMDEDQEDEFSDDDDLGGGSDDDDSSWKVRRSAIKVVNAIIQCRPEMLEDLYESCSNQIISRFKEREENVRIDVISCFMSLLQATIETRRQASTAITSVSPDAIRDSRQQKAVEALQTRLPAVIKGSLRYLNTHSSPKTSVAILQMLRSLCNVLNGGLDEYMPSLMVSIHMCVTDSKNQSLKLEALLFLRYVMELHAPIVFHPHLDQVVKDVTACVAEDWYKIIAEALRCVGAIIRVMRPRSRDDDMFEAGFDYAPYSGPLYAAVLRRLDAHDIDQEIKECAIEAMGLLVTHMGDQLGKELPNVFSLLMERLTNEITRMAALKALGLLCTSPLKLDLSPILSEATSELALFLRKQSRPLKQSTLEALSALVVANGAKMGADLFTLLIKETSGLVSDADLHLCHLTLDVIRELLVVEPAVAPVVGEETLPRMLTLVSSPLLQGLALTSLQGLFEGLAAIGTPGLAFENLMEKLKEVATASGAVLPRQAVGSIARCMAALCVQADEATRADTVGSLVMDMKGEENVPKHLALLVVGELGRKTNLNEVKKLEGIIQGTFEDGSEECKTAAAYALGHMAVGNMSAFLPTILNALEASHHQYLLLSALKEVIICHSQDQQLDIGPYVDQVLPHLIGHCRSSEEGVRNMVAECLGALVTQKPAPMIQSLLTLGTDTDPLAKWTVATSLKYAMAGAAPEADLGPSIPQFLNMLLADEDLDVLRAALLMVTAAAHHQPSLVEEHIQSIITPVLLQTIELKRERVVDLGPFKYRVDDGEPVRKAALGCIDTILDSMSGRLDLGELMPQLAKGVADAKPDVQMLCHQILTRICDMNPGAVLSNLEALLEPLNRTCTKPIKEGQVGTEVERANELTRSALRTVVALGRIPDVRSYPKYAEIKENLQKTPRLQEMLSVIDSE